VVPPLLLLPQAASIPVARRAAPVAIIPMRQGLNDIDDSFFLCALGSLRSRNLPAARTPGAPANYGCHGRRSIGVLSVMQFRLCLRHSAIRDHRVD
jgi:hypothetical protein